MVKKAHACEETLNGFARQKWLDYSLDDIKFPSDWRKQLAKTAIRIITVEQLCKELLPAYHLQFSSLEVCAQELVDIIISTTLANSPNLPSPQELTQNSPSNLPRPTGLATTPARAPL